MKFYGKIGFFVGSNEAKPGIYTPVFEEKMYSGNVSWNNRHYQNSDNQNDEIRLNSQISILSDLYSQENFTSIRYVVWNGVKWRVTNVEMNYPRIVLTIGGIYNGTGTKETGAT